MVCNSCSNSLSVHVYRSGGGSSTIMIQKQVLLRPKKKLGPITVLRPANKDKYRA